jgi:signal transduction histidine kinase
MTDARDLAADAREADADARDADADARDVGAAADLEDVQRLLHDADDLAAGADLRLAEANVALQSAKEHLHAAAAHEAAADHKTEDAERLMSYADEQLITAAAKLAEATSDSEEYQRALYHYTQLVRHRMANPLHIIGGAAATLQAQPDLPDGERGALLEAIYRQAKILERVCLEPKIMHPSENDLRPRPAPHRPTAAEPGHISDGPPGVLPVAPRGSGSMDR